MQNVLYHGTKSEFNAFDFSRCGSATPDMSATGGLGAWFTDCYEYVQAYARNAGGNTIYAALVDTGCIGDGWTSEDIEAFVEERGTDGARAALQDEGATVSALVRRTGQGLELQALMAFGDEPKPGAREALAALKARGIRTVMISGDNRGAALAMARRLGLDEADVRAEVLPSDKAAQVVALQQGEGGARRTVAMVGDGVNDAPALAAADVGMAMGNGTDVAMHAAGITLMRGDVGLVPAALDISQRTVAKIRQNLFWAFFYNAAGIPLAALGYLSPVLAGAAMALSSVSVMSNALLLRRWRPASQGGVGTPG